MEAEQWSRIEELFHASLALDSVGRSEFLSQQCLNDSTLRLNVERLIIASEKVPTFIADPDQSLGYRVLSLNGVSVDLGQQIKHYQIKKQLGKGGMGEVYLAEDQDLEREVALKFFDPLMAGNDWAREQLIGEARAIARLEHNNICGVYGFEEVDDHTFIVMQYVKGETLENLLGRSSLSSYQAICFAEQIASALSAAHDQGIVHRDIKPRNMIVTPEGQIKVLDFGLAKLTRRPVSDSPLQPANNNVSTFGVGAGTAAYMSPEQAELEPLDFRSDIFSFGIVLYEMLTGTNPFLRANRDATIEAIKECQPAPPTRSGKPVNREIRQITENCLAKDRSARFATTTDLLNELKAQRAKLADLEPAVLRERRQRRRRRARIWALVAAPLLLALLLGANFLRIKFTGKHSLAVLKLVNNTKDPSLDYLTDGLTGSLVAKFASFGRIETKAPTEIDGRAGREKGIVQLGRELKVEAVLYGELVKEDGATLLRLHMMDPARGEKEWEQTYNISTEDLFTLQNNITATVTSNLGLFLTQNERRLVDKWQTKSPEAQKLYMTGRHYLQIKRTPENLQLALNNFERAIELDPAFAKAYAARADAYIFMANVAYGPILTKDALEKARFDANLAVDTDPSIAESHNALGRVRMWCEWNLAGAEAEFLKAIELNPVYPQAHYDYSRLLSVLGRYDEALRQSQIAVEYDPYSLSSRINYGRTLYYARRSNDAEVYFQKLVDENPNNYQVLHALGLVTANQGRYSQAVVILERAHKLESLATAGALGYVYGKAGQMKDAQRMLDLLDQFATKQPVPVYERALIYLGMGKRDDLWRVLELAFQNHYPNLVNLGVDPMFDELRTDPRFIDLVRRIGLPNSPVSVSKVG